MRRIFHKDLGMMPYKVQLVQELMLIDHPLRFRFAKWACNRLTEDADFGKKKISFQMKLILILVNDFFLFSYVKDKIRGQRFSTPEEAVDAFRMHVLEIPQAKVYRS